MGGGGWPYKTNHCYAVQKNYEENKPIEPWFLDDPLRFGSASRLGLGIGLGMELGLGMGLGCSKGESQGRAENNIQNELTR